MVAHPLHTKQHNTGASTPTKSREGESSPTRLLVVSEHKLAHQTDVLFLVGGVRRRVKVEAVGYRCCVRRTIQHTRSQSGQTSLDLDIQHSDLWRSSMSVSRNPFSALDEDYKPESAVESVAPKAVESAPKEVVAKQTTSKKRDPTRQTAGESRRGGDYVPRGGRNGKPRGPPNANEAFSNDKTVGHAANAEKSTEDTVARGTARGRGRGRGSGARREFDRRNASGKTDTAKATEQSWGNEAEAQQSATAEPTDAQDPAAPEPEVKAQAPAAAEEEEEDNTVSYEEYLKQKAEKALNISQPKIRAANEGADDSKWGDKEFTRDADNDQYFAGIQKTKAASQRERKQKETLEIEQRFYQAPTAPRGRGMSTDNSSNHKTNSAGEGRGRGRGSRGTPRGRGAARGEGRPRTQEKASQGANLTLNDDAAFPTLS